jgi:hypothetical protein
MPAYLARVNERVALVRDDFVGLHTVVKPLLGRARQ